MDLELVSFDRCPFVQRSVITLLYKSVPFKITYIDLAAKPDWFLAISPFGRVPILRVEDGERETVLFESAAINEFIDEVTEGRLHPEDPIRRAHNRAWIEFGSTLFNDNYRMSIAKSELEFREGTQQLHDHMMRVEQHLGGGPYFNGEAFSLVDAAYAPFFMRAELWRNKVAFYDSKEFPKMAAWGEALLALDAVKQSVVDDFADRVFGSAQKQDTYLGQLAA